MKSLIGVILVLAVSAGCLIRTRGNGQSHSNSSRASCPPSQHWNGNSCEHNGRGRGHEKHKKHKKHKD